MSFFCTFSEIAYTFPARGLSINGTAPKHDAFIGLREAVCPICKKKFSYTPGVHRYVRDRKNREYKLCSYHCLREWDTKKGDPIEKRIIDLQKRIAFLKEQAELPPSERTDPRVYGKDIGTLIANAERRLSTAYSKRAKAVLAG